MASIDDDVDGNQVDSDYEGICKPPILRQLRNILDQYPDGSQIIRELVQNAEDAGASIFKIFYKEGSHESGPKTSSSRYANYFRTPALCVHNDGVFSEEDWKGIKSIYTSVKEKDALKVGRFGLGFKSIFHITDSPIIISGDQLLIINPMELPHRVCHRIPFRKLKTSKYKEAWSLMKRNLGLEGNGLFGLNEETIDNQHYPKTLFWFPTRQEVSELSNKICTTDKMTELFESFEEEAETILLFLKSVNLISIYDSQFQKKFEVQMKGIEDEDITEKREYIKNKITTNDIPTESLWSQYKAALITWKPDTSQSLQEWLIINHFQGRRDMSDRMYTLAQDEQLGYAPYVGLAFPLTRMEGKMFSGHVFCFLPLPIEPDGKSLTNLPVHVNGFFALTSNRRHMLWATHDQHEADDNRLIWNKLMISELLPAAYIRLVEVLLDDSNILPEVVYSSLPDAENIDPKWSILLQPVYKKVFGLKLFHTENKTRIDFHDALFFIFDEENENISTEIKDTLWKVLTEYSENIVSLPCHLQFAVIQTDFLPKRTKAKTINTELICSLLQKNPRYQLFPGSWKLHILQYLLDNASEVNKFQNLQILPTNDRKLCVSLEAADKPVYICLNGEEKMFPLIQEKLVSTITGNTKQNLIKLAKSGEYKIKLFDSSDFAPLLRDSIEKIDLSTDVEEAQQCEISIWIVNVWKYLSDNEEFIETVQSLPILPEMQDIRSPCIKRFHKLEGLHMLKKQVSTALPLPVCEVLNSFGVTLLSTLPGYLPNAIIERYVYFPTVSGVCDVLEKTLQQFRDHECLIERFEKLPESTRQTFAIFLSQAKDFSAIVKSFLRKLKMFPVVAIKSKTDLSEVKNLTPQNYKECPISFPYPLIDGDFVGAQLVFGLGCCRQNAEKLTMDILNIISKGDNFYDKEEIDLFMEYLLTNIERASEEQLKIASTISFIYSEDGERRRARELYEMTEEIQLLFLGEKDRFPRNQNFIRKHLNGLKKLGLKSANDISVDDLMPTLNMLTHMTFEVSNVHLISKIRSFEQVVNRLFEKPLCRTELEKKLLENMKTSRWMTSKNAQPKHYPPNMQWHSEVKTLQIPCEMFHPDYEMLIGSVAMITESSLSFEILSQLLQKKPSLELVFKQLLHLSAKYKDCTNHSEFLHILCAIYDYLTSESTSELNADNYKESAIVWTGNVFAKPKDVFIDNLADTSELSLEPYMFQLRAEKKIHESLFSRLGCVRKLEVFNLLNILDEIKDRQEISHAEQSTHKHNLQVVERILNVLEELNDRNILSENEQGRILIPVVSNFNDFQLLPANECTYVDYKRETDEIEEDEEDLKYVHHKIRSSLAENLGVPSLTRRIVEIKGVEDIPWGQKEELTDRLKNLIQEYADGTSVLKEMLQNADDAGATCLRILFDERTNENARFRLIDKGMAECQGPAIWVYNDAQFTEKDFENIIKLGAGTKETDLTKIGKFGLGFCSVYNITDMPSILSGESLVILDPRMIHLGKALKNNNPGLRFKISDSKTRRRLRNQIQPFNGVFGCDFENDFTSYEGTLFRLPLRTAKQADETNNQISPRQYTRDDVIKLTRKFFEHAGNLVLFLQNVKEIEFLHWQKETSEAELFYKIQRNSKNAKLNDKTNVLQIAKSFLDIPNSIPKQKQENIIVSINICDVDLNREIFKTNVTNMTSKTEWMIFWQIGCTESCAVKQIATNNAIVGGTACPQMTHLQMKGREGESTQMPLGFYSTGHVFCFLPLPQQSFCPVHVNGYFAVEASRRRLVISNTDNKHSEAAEWNKFLLKTVVCESYLNMLEVMPIADSQINCYENWPFLGQDNMMNELVLSFYETLVESSHNLFYSGESTKYSFKSCVFLNPGLRYGLGQAIGGKALECFLEFNSYKPDRYATDLPEDVYNQFLKIPYCRESLGKVFCDNKAFFLNSFFPSCTKNFWDNSTTERNQLVLFALQIEDDELIKKIKETNCIPTSPHGKLRKPSDLVYPNPIIDGFSISSLFSVEDERFPSEEFNTSKVVEKLKSFGMMINTLSNELVLDRVKSIQRLSAKPAKMQERRQLVFKYLERNLDSHHSIQTALQNIKFLPVLQKPPNWPFAWYSSESRRFECGKKLCLKKCKNIIGCVRPIIDLDYKVEPRVFKYLGLQTTSEINEEDVVNQFKEITNCPSTESSSHVQTVFEEIYRFFNERKCPFLALFKDKCCILSESAGLVKPTACVLDLDCDLKPFLFKVDRRWRIYENFLENIGVKETVSVKHLVEIINAMKLKEGESSCHTPVLVKLLNMLSTSERYEEFLTMCTPEKMLLPDTQGLMRRPSELCIDDERNVTKDVKFLFVNKDLNTGTTCLFRIKSKSAQFIKGFAGAVSFGQSESLITRLKGILEDCPYSVSILNELIQNADDAGATEIHFVHDQRSHPTETIFDKSLAQTQGPSLVVFNNSCFSKNDIEGISKLGEGSKRSDPMATGQFGIGFNAVYHITDVPSFLTIGETVPNGGALVMFDPHCKYVPLATPQNPGMMIENIQMIADEFPDMYNAYLTKEISEKRGTWFRFPLRTKSMAEQSKIKSGSAMTNQNLEECFIFIKEDIQKSLIFLSNIMKISLSVITDDGKMKQIASVSSYRDSTVLEKLREFNQQARQHTDALRSGEIKLGQKRGVSVQFTQELNISTQDKKYREIWSISHVCGTFVTKQIDPELDEGFKNKIISLSPRAGVAFKITTNPDVTISTAFNFLPLPIQTKLPVHVNAHFAVDSARTNIFEYKKGEDIKEIWNIFLLEHAIPYAYLELICFLREHLFASKKMNPIDNLFVYNNAFPVSKDVENTRWENLVRTFYQIAFKENITIFPMYLPPRVCGIFVEEQHMLNEEIKKEKFGALSFMSLKNDSHYFSSYFHPYKTEMLANDTLVPSDKSRFEYEFLLETGLADVLKRLGLKLLDASADVAESVHKALGSDQFPPYIQRIHIIDFLKSWNTNAKDKCLVSRVGISLSETNLKDTETVKKILSFCFGPGMNDHLHHLEGIPLCVQSDNILQIFSKEHTIYVSYYMDLLPNSASKFLHKDLVEIFFGRLEIAERFLLPLNIQNFAKLVENEPSLSRLKSAVPLQDCIGNKNWFKRFWTFLSGFSQTNLFEECDKFLAKWCLIPAEMNGGGMLYPFKLRFAVLDTKSFFESHSENPEEQKIGKILTSLHIPSPSMEMISQSYRMRDLVKRICASLYSPDDILDCLLHHKKEYALSGEDAKALLMFLYHKLRDKMDKLKNKFKGLILFELYDGTLSSLENAGTIIALKENSVPKCGLKFLLLHCKLTILKYNPYLYELYGAFSVREIDILDFYMKYFLPNSECYDYETRINHIKYIKNQGLFQKGGDTMKRLVASFPFVQNAVTKRLQRVCEFITPYSRISRRMCTEEELLPLGPFQEDENWKEFFIYAGLKTDIPTKMFLRFANDIEKRQGKGNDAQLLSDSKLLLTEILKMPDLHKQKSFIRELRTVNFLHPTIVKTAYSRVVDSFIKKKSLISFENAVYVESKMLVWSTCKILPDLKCQNIHNWNSIEKLLGVKQTPDVKDVTSHVHKLCYQLASMVKKENKFQQLSTDTGDELDCFMERIYSELKTYAQKENKMKEIKQGLSETPMFYNKETNCFLRWDQIVLELKREEEIPKYLCRGSEIYGTHFEFFRQLGVMNEANLFHYARVFSQLQIIVQDRTLFVEEISVCQKAMDGFLNSMEKMSKLSLSEEQKFDELFVFPCIYLPSDDDKLEKSFNLTVFDVPELGERLKKVQYEQIKYVKKAHSSSSRHRMLLALPDGFRPKCISQQVKEVVHVVDLCESSDVVKDLNKKFRTKEFTDGLCVILETSDRISEDEKTKYKEKLQELRFWQVSALETILVCQSTNAKIQCTKEPREVFYDKDESVVYIKVDQMSKDRHVRDLAFNAIVKCTNGLAQQHREEMTRLLECDTIKEINDVLSRFNVRIESKWEPELGSYVPQDLHDYLEMSIQDLKPGEIVALEVLNPGLDDVPDYAYIYVKVMKKIDSYMFPMYDINNGSDIHCEIAYKLYRFVQPNEHGLSREIDRYTDLQEEAYRHQKGVIFDEIKTALVTAWWHYPHEFKRIKFRLLLNWHPDKNPNNPLAKEVTQYILKIIEQLKRGEFKQDSKANSNSWQRSYNYYYRQRRSRSGNNESQFRDRNFARAQPMNNDNDEWMCGFFSRRRQWRRSEYWSWNTGGGGGGGGGSGGMTKPTEKLPNPQPQVGLVWFSQAKYNMKSAIMEKENCATSDWDKGMNWICYKCHMAIETSVRSLIYSQDADKNNPKNHDLVSLSNQLSIPELQDLCRKFQSEVCNSPDRMIFPSQNSVPGEMFTSNQVDTACTIAQKVIGLCDEQFNA